MQKKDYEKFPVIQSFLDRLNFAIRDRFRKSKVVPMESINWFGIESVSILSQLMTLSERYGDNLTIGRGRLAEMSNVSIKVARIRLERFVLFGLVERESEWLNDGTNRRKPSKIKIHRHLLTALSKGVGVGVQAEAIKYFSEIGYNRLIHDQDVSPETEENFNDLASKVVADKASKQKEILEWQKHDKAFVESSAFLWTKAQQTMGLGSNIPNWAGEVVSLTPAARKERRELTKTFQQYGGKITALAWYIFVCGEPELDDLGRPKFLPSSPHRQFVSIDRKPSQFAKHFNAILSDHHFTDMGKKKWNIYGEQLRKVYGDLLDILPRNGESERNKIGFTIGVDESSLSDLGNNT